MMVHSMFGRRVNSPLSLLAQRAAKELTHMDVGCFDDDDGFLLFPQGGQELPQGILRHIDPPPHGYER
jgi:ATP-dependent Lhr-like helicase